jgi:hypothetical protein
MSNTESNAQGIHRRTGDENISHDMLEYVPSPLVRSVEEKAAILDEYKDRPHEKCFYCHRTLPVGTPNDPFYYDRAYELNSINFVTYRKDPFFAEINGDSTKKWICQERVWDSL